MEENGVNDIGLALSGGGFRATLFHLGAIWRLNEMGLLPNIDSVSSVSGGSILAGLLATRWNRLEFECDVAVNLESEIVRPTLEYCSRNVDWSAVLCGLVLGTWKLEQSYRKYLVGNATLDQLPDSPKFIFNAAHIETGRNCTLSNHGLHTWRLGDVPLHSFSLAKAMAASSACPPWFPAVTLKPDASAFVGTGHSDLIHRDDLKRTISLSDGGAYDNLGIHAIRHCRTLLVSDGGGVLQATRGKRIARQLNHRFMRPMQTSLEQTRAIRRRNIVDKFESKLKKGTLWTATTDVRRYPVQEGFDIKPEWRHHFASVRTRLNAFSNAEKSRLVNWGYVMCDLSIRSYYLLDEPAPHQLPFPDFHFVDPPGSPR